MTASRGWRGSSDSALGVPALRNSAYASSTTTMPGATSTSVSMSDSGRAVPVGLFGEASRTTDGWCCSIAASAADNSIVKSSARRPTTHRECVSRAYSGYIEYVGANESTVRPGPAKACSTCSITSFEPLAAHTFSARRPVAPSALR